MICLLYSCSRSFCSSLEVLEPSNKDRAPNAKTQLGRSVNGQAIKWRHSYFTMLVVPHDSNDRLPALDCWQINSVPWLPLFCSLITSTTRLDACGSWSAYELEKLSSKHGPWCVLSIKITPRKSNDMQNFKMCANTTIPAPEWRIDLQTEGTKFG